jgi:hypothetical protein
MSRFRCKLDFSGKPITRFWRQSALNIDPLPVNICGDLSDLQYYLKYEDWSPSLIMIDLDGIADIAVTLCRILNLRQ